jgi:hypothetical protein
VPSGCGVEYNHVVSERFDLFEDFGERNGLVDTWNLNAASQNREMLMGDL